MTMVYNTPQTSFNELSNRIVVDMSEAISLLEPSASPLTVLLSKLSKNPATQQKFEWMEDQLESNWSAITNNASNVGAFI